MLGSELTEISKRFKEAQIGLKEMLTVIDLTLTDHPKGSGSFFPEDLLGGLDELIDRTVHGTRIERFRPRKGNSHCGCYGYFHPCGMDCLGHK